MQLSKIWPFLFVFLQIGMNWFWNVILFLVFSFFLIMTQIEFTHTLWSPRAKTIFFYSSQFHIILCPCNASKYMKAAKICQRTHGKAFYFYLLSAPESTFTSIPKPAQQYTHMNTHRCIGLVLALVYNIQSLNRETKWVPLIISCVDLHYLEDSAGQTFSFELLLSFS